MEDEEEQACCCSGGKDSRERDLLTSSSSSSSSSSVLGRGHPLPHRRGRRHLNTLEKCLIIWEDDEIALNASFRLRIGGPWLLRLGRLLGVPLAIFKKFLLNVRSRKLTAALRTSTCAPASLSASPQSSPSCSSLCGATAVPGRKRASH